MPRVAADTHSIIWYLVDDPRLSNAGLAALEEAVEDGSDILIPSICLVEIAYLTEKGRIAPLARNLVHWALDEPATGCKLVPLSREIADMLPSIPRAEVPDMPDRIIAATALVLDVPLISADRRIRSSSVRTIW